MGSCQPAVESKSTEDALASLTAAEEDELIALRACQELVRAPRPVLRSRSPATELFSPEFQGPTNIFCVTLYNESMPAFEKTIVSLLIAIRQFHRRADRGAQFSLLSIVADGRGKVDPGILGMLRSCGFTANLGQRTGEAELHAVCQAWDTLTERFDLPQPSISNHLEGLRVLVCLKDRNAGKLHSHELFFNTICRALKPTYCYQIDTGTILEPDAVTRVVDRMERSPDCAALALRILPSRPEPGATLLSTWQYLDCALQKCVLWPFEMATGHLSVVPGQACVFRWRALNDVEGGREFGGASGALSRYLRGLHGGGPLERVMYLAEDRVIGNQIVLTQGKCWRLGYAVEAGAITDSCTTLGELFRQRRRWRNGATACRLWMLAQWPGVLARIGRGGTGQGISSGAMMAQTLLLVLDFIAPAQLAALLKVLFVSVANAPIFIAVSLYTSLAASLALLPIDARCSVWRPLKPISRLLTWGRRIACLGLSLALLCILVATLPIGGCIVLLLAPALALPAMLLALPRASFSVLARAQMFPLAELLMIAALSFYALWNFHDVSWGTKGLRRCETEVGLTRKLLSWRNALLSAWLLTNAALIAVALDCRGIVFRSISPVVEVTSLANAVTVALSLYFLVRRRFHYE